MPGNFTQTTMAQRLMTNFSTSVPLQLTHSLGTIKIKSPKSRQQPCLYPHLFQKLGNSMTADHLRSHTAKDLAQMARKAGISGWHGMRKEELIRALLLTARRRVSKDRYRAHRLSISGKKGNFWKKRPDFETEPC